MKSIIAAAVLSVAATSAFGDERPNTAKHLACVEAETAKLPPNPLAKSESMTKGELDAQFSAYVDKETAALQRCYSEKEVRILAEANYLIGLAVSRCGGVLRNKEVIEFGQGPRLELFGRHEDATAVEYKDTNERMNAEPNGQVVARFCQGIIDRFGPNPDYASRLKKQVAAVAQGVESA